MVYFYIMYSIINTMINNNDIIREMNTYYNWSKSTINLYEIVVRKYTEYHNKSLKDLLNEAEREEEQGIVLKKRTIKKRLMMFQQYLIQLNYKESTIITFMSKIKAIYNFYEITLPKLPIIRNTAYETILDIPNKDHIAEALENTNNLKLKAIILFISSSGMGRNEATNLTVEDYLNATIEYHSNKNYTESILELCNRHDIVPTFHIKRIKTNYPYYTFCTPEASDAINKMLKDRLLNKGLKPNEALFGMKAKSLTIMFQRLNDKCGFGWKKTRRFFHPHNLRKYFISTLFNEGIDFYTIEFLCGHKISSTQEAYYKASPDKQKQKYMSFMDKLSIFQTEKKNIADKKDKKELEERIKKLEEIVNILLPD